MVRAVLRRLDLALLRVLRTRGHAPPIELVVTRFSRLGEHGALWFAMAAVGAALDRRLRSRYRRALRAVAVAYGLNTAAKLAIRRARPLLEDLPALSPTLTTLSFPSAHASTSFAGAHALARALPAPPLYALAATMALSRPYLGVHYPSDALAGGLLGLAVAEVTP